MTRFWTTAAIWLGSVVAATAQTTAPAAPGSAATTAVHAEQEAQVLPRPRVRGDNFELELTTKIQGDFPRFDPVVDEDDEEFSWRRRRVGIRGELFGRVSFEVEREFGDEDDPWRDVYLNLKASDLFELRGGKFKVPFSLDNLTGATAHDFVNRSLAARTIAPGRDIGLMLHGRTDGRRLTYAVGAFKGLAAPRDTSFFDDDQAGESLGLTVAGRVTLQPMDGMNDLPRAIRNLELGVNGSWSELPEGLNGFRGRSVYRYEFFEPVYVKGDRIRGGVDALMRAGPASLSAEWISVWDGREEQGLGDATLPRAFARGWYVAGTWLLTGEDKEEDIRPKRPFLEAGIGAVEVAARYERFLLGSTDTDGEPAFANPRAANLLRNRDDATTFGLTWYLNRWIRLQGNAIRETFDDVNRAPIIGRRSYWSYVGRFQFVL